MPPGFNTWKDLLDFVINMPPGFKTWKDLLDIVIVPLVILGVGALLPRWFESVRTRKFLALIKRELEEMVPKEKAYGKRWHRYLDKRFIHENIFDDKFVSDNRDFILSLPPTISYHTYQLWTHFEKAKKSRTKKSLADHGYVWCYHLNKICEFFDREEGLKRHPVSFFSRLVSRKLPEYSLADRLRYGDFYLSVCEPWMDLMILCHSDLLEKLQKLSTEKHRQWPKPNESSLETSKSI